MGIESENLLKREKSFVLCYHSDKGSSMLHTAFPFAPSVHALYVALWKRWPVRLLTTEMPCSCSRWFMQSTLHSLFSPACSDRLAKRRSIVNARMRGNETRLIGVCEHVGMNLRHRQRNNAGASQITAMIVSSKSRAALLYLCTNSIWSYYIFESHFFSSVTISCCVFVICPCSSFWIHFRFMKAGFHFSFAQEILPTIFWFGVMIFDVVQHKAGVIVSFHIHSLHLGRIQALSVCVCVSFPAYASNIDLECTKRGNGKDHY